MDLGTSQQEYTRYSLDCDLEWEIIPLHTDFLSTRLLSGAVYLAVRVLRSENRLILWSSPRFPRSSIGQTGSPLFQARHSSQSHRPFSSFTTLTNPNETKLYSGTSFIRQKNAIDDLSSLWIFVPPERPRDPSQSAYSFTTPPARSFCHSFLYALAVSYIYLLHNLLQIPVGWRASRPPLITFCNLGVPIQGDCLSALSQYYRLSDNFSFDYLTHYLTKLHRTVNITFSWLALTLSCSYIILCLFS